MHLLGQVDYQDTFNKMDKNIISVDLSSDYSINNALLTTNNSSTTDLIFNVTTRNQTSITSSHVILKQDIANGRSFSILNSVSNRAILVEYPNSFEVDGVTKFLKKIIIPGQIVTFTRLFDFFQIIYDSNAMGSFPIIRSPSTSNYNSLNRIINDSFVARANLHFFAGHNYPMRVFSQHTTSFLEGLNCVDSSIESISMTSESKVNHPTLEESLSYQPPKREGFFYEYFPELIPTEIMPQYHRSGRFSFVPFFDSTGLSTNLLGLRMPDPNSILLDTIDYDSSIKLGITSFGSVIYENSEVTSDWCPIASSVYYSSTKSLSGVILGGFSRVSGRFPEWSGLGSGSFNLKVEFSFPYPENGSSTTKGYL